MRGPCGSSHRNSSQTAKAAVIFGGTQEIRQGKGNYPRARLFLSCPAMPLLVSLVRLVALARAVCCVLGIRACVGVLLGIWPLSGLASCGRRLRESECGVVVAEWRPCGLAAAPVGAGKVGCIAKAAFSTGAQLAPPFSPAPSPTTGQLRYGH